MMTNDDILRACENCPQTGFSEELVKPRKLRSAYFPRSSKRTNTYLETTISVLRHSLS